MNPLDYLKMIGNNLVLTGFRDKYNLLVDRVIYDVTAELNETAGTVLTFYTNLGELDVVVPVSLASLTDIEFTNVQQGQTIIYDGTNWVNSYPALATLIDVELTNPQNKDVLMYNGTNWVNGISENNDYTSNIFINDGDTYTTTISTLDEILGLLAPAKPGNLSSKSLTVSPIYTTTPFSIIQTQSGISRTYITDDTTPIIEITPYTNTPASTNNGVYNSASGTLSSTLTIDEGGANTLITTPIITFTAGDESGTSVQDGGNNLSLTVTHDFDYHFGIIGKQGFWRAFLSRVQILNALPYYPTEQHNISMTHSDTGTTDLTFFIDDPQTPSITNLLISTDAIAPQARHISGVPSLSTGDVINSQFILHDAIKTFYNSRIANITSTWTSSVNDIQSGIKIYGDDHNVDIDVVALTNKYTEDIVLTNTGYNSKHQTIATGNFTQTTGTIATTQIGKKMRIDTVSNETIRTTSDTGLYPTSGYGNVYDSTMNIKTDLGYTEELLMINGLFRFPSVSDDFTSNWPEAGPDYSTGMNTGSGYRWVTFDLGNHNNVPAVRFGFNSASGFTFDLLTNKILNDMKVYVKCGSATAWLDGNEPYNSGTFNVNTNGSGALDIGGSLNGTTNRRVTFGGTVTGNIYVRIGIANGITGISFASITELPL
jgi:hypothetical protein